MKKYEYKVTVLNSESHEEDQLNNLGQQGWMLVNLHGSVCTLMREIVPIKWCDRCNPSHPLNEDYTEEWDPDAVVANA